MEKKASATFGTLPSEDTTTVRSSVISLHVDDVNDLSVLPSPSY